MTGGDLSGMRDMRSIVVVGQGALSRPDGAAILGHAMRMCEVSDSKLLVLHTAASRVGAMDVGAANEGGIEAALAAEVILNLGADEVEIPPRSEGGPFVIYQGSHGDRGAHRADVILPAAAWTEEPGLFVNTEGRPQMAMRSGFAPGEAKDNWAILRALSAEVGQALPYDSMPQLRQALVKAHPHLGAVDEVPENEWRAVEPGDVSDEPLRSPVRDFHLSNPIARASEVMATLSSNARARRDQPRLAAE